MEMPCLRLRGWQAKKGEARPLRGPPNQEEGVHSQYRIYDCGRTETSEYIGTQTNDIGIPNARILKVVDGLLDTLRSQSEGTVRQPGRARHALELRDLLGLLATKQRSGVVQPAL